MAPKIDGTIQAADRKTQGRALRNESCTGATVTWAQPARNGLDRRMTVRVSKYAAGVFRVARGSRRGVRCVSDGIAAYSEDIMSLALLALLLIAPPDGPGDREKIRQHIDRIYQAFIHKDLAELRATHNDRWLGFMTWSGGL